VLWVEVEASRELASATLVVTYESGPRRQLMDVAGSRASTQYAQALDNERPETWRVEVAAVDGAQTETEPVPACE
jgi:hypothetical protein